MKERVNVLAGLQHSVIFSSEKYGLPLTEKIMPQYMQELGYRTHFVGKVPYIYTCMFMHMGFDKTKQE